MVTDFLFCTWPLTHSPPPPLHAAVSMQQLCAVDRAKKIFSDEFSSLALKLAEILLYTVIKKL